MSERSGIDMTEQLWAMLPAIYRSRDKEKDGHLKIFLGAFGTVLNSIYKVLEQHLEDISPDNSQAQEWLIPYFADLLDVRLVSPHAKGQKQEVAKAISWRQGKGTLHIVRQIAEEIGDLKGKLFIDQESNQICSSKVVIHEGFNRVISTVAFDRPAFNLRLVNRVVPKPVFARNAKIINGIGSKFARRLGMVYTPGRILTASDLLNYKLEQTKFGTVKPIPRKLLQRFQEHVDNIRSFKLDRAWHAIAGWSLKKVKEEKPEIIAEITGQRLEAVDSFMRHIKRLSYSIDNKQEGRINLGDFIPVWHALTDKTKWPRLPMGTVDFRKDSRAIRVAGPAAFTHTIDFGEARPVFWAHKNLHGVPYRMDSYQDCSGRSVDVRKPDWRVGHYHHKRVLLYTPIPDGFFCENQKKIPWGEISDKIKEIEELKDLSPFDLWEDIGKGWRQFVPMIHESDPQMENGAIVLIDQAWFKEYKPGEDNIPEIHRTIFCRNPKREWSNGNSYPIITGEIEPEYTGGIKRIFCFEKVVLKNALKALNVFLELRETAVNTISAEFNNPALFQSNQGDYPFIDAKDSLINGNVASVYSGNGSVTALCRLEYCTALCAGQVKVGCSLLQASDSIILGNLVAAHGKQVRYCCCPKFCSSEDFRSIKYEPLFYKYSDINPDNQAREIAFGKPGCGVLHPACRSEIRFGAEDGGEMGAYHHRRYTLREEAIIDKVKEFLPAGMEPALIPGKYWQAPLKKNQ